MRKFVVLALCLTGSLIALAADTPKDFAAPKVPADFKSYCDPQKRFTIQYPADWKDKATAEDFSIAAGKPGAPENVNVRWVNVGNAGLAEIAEQSVEAMKKSIAECKFETSQATKFGDLNAHYMLLSGKFGDQTVKIGELLISKAPMLYVITFGTTPERWDEGWPVGQQVFASFKPGEPTK
jgi:hypothetical protein